VGKLVGKIVGDFVNVGEPENDGGDDGMRVIDDSGVEMVGTNEGVKDNKPDDGGRELNATGMMVPFCCCCCDGGAIAAGATVSFGSL